MRFVTLDDWLRWQETLHPKTIDLGLERVRAVGQRLYPGAPSCIVITVAGTNGKGSCVAFLDSILRAAGYRVGAYTSPHLLRYNERIRIDGAEAEDGALCQTFARIDAARDDISLTHGRGIAQPGSAPALGAGCRGFKSLYPDHCISEAVFRGSWSSTAPVAHADRASAF